MLMLLWVIAAVDRTNKVFMKSGVLVAAFSIMFNFAGRHLTVWNKLVLTQHFYFTFYIFAWSFRHSWFQGTEWLDLV